MPATCLDIITYAMRQARVLSLGKEPKANETADGLVALQSLYDEWRTGGMFGTLEDVYLDGDDTAQEGMRYYVPAGFTLTEPTSEYLDSTEVIRQPRDLSLYEALTSTGTHTAKLYDRTEWVSLLGLELTDTAPLSSRNAYGLAACLATSGGFIAMFGGDPSPAVVGLARNFLRNVMSKFGSTQDKIPAEYF